MVMTNQEARKRGYGPVSRGRRELFESTGERLPSEPIFTDILKQVEVELFSPSLLELHMPPLTDDQIGRILKLSRPYRWVSINNVVKLLRNEHGLKTTKADLLNALEHLKIPTGVTLNRRRRVDPIVFNQLESIKSHLKKSG